MADVIGTDEGWDEVQRHLAISAITAPEIEALCERLGHAHIHSQQRVVGSHIFAEAATALRQQQAVIARLEAELSRK
jgi:hypothetical protein